jgi:hypothetical protein
MVLVVLAAMLAAWGQVEVRVLNGRPTPYVDGQPLALTGYSPMAWDKPYTDRQLPRFAPHRMGVYYICPPVVNGDFFGTQFWVGDQVSSTPLVTLAPNGYQGIDDAVQVALKGDPAARIIIRFGTYEPGSWAKLHKDQYFINDEGAPFNCPSMASDLYWNTSCAFTTAIVQYCETRPWANRVIGYANFHRTEGCWEPAITGWIYDHSPVMTARWRAFLQEKYGSEDALRAAWGDPSLTLDNLKEKVKTVEALRAAFSDMTLTFENVRGKYKNDDALRAAYRNPYLTFATVEVPTDRLRGPVPVAAKSLYWQAARDNAPLRDYLELQRALFHQRFRQLSAALRAGSSRKVLFLHDALKQTMLGWDIDEFFVMNEPRSPVDPETMSVSGSMNVAELFDAPGCDGLITPHDYQARGVGGIFEPEGIADSTVLRGKLFTAEMDLRTYTDKYNGYGRARDLREFSAVTWRNFATALTRGFWYYWMDLSADWFSAPEMHPIIEQQTRLMEQSLQWKHETVPGIAVILDDSAALETNGTANYMNEALQWQLKEGLARCGVPVRVYLLEDLALPNFPDHRVYYFPNLFKVDDARLKLLKEKVFRNGHVVVWGPGSGISDGATISAANAEKLTGFRFEMLPVNFTHRVLISNFDHPVTRGLSADTVLGGPLSYGPLLFPTDGDPLGLAWTKLGRYNTGLAVKTFGNGAGKNLGPGDYAAVFTHAVPLPADLWRNLARWGGAHVYCATNDILLADSSIVALHSLQSGPKTLSLPGVFKVTDLQTGKVYSSRARSVSFILQGPETKVFHLEAPRQ